jgi:plasmid stabilization system protein ParE
VKIRLTPRARRRALAVAKWWRENRAASDLFEQELEQAKRRLAEQPDLGLEYETVRGVSIRRLLLPKSEQHIYYSVDRATKTVIIYHIWGGRRGRGPKL